MFFKSVRDFNNVLIEMSDWEISSNIKCQIMKLEQMSGKFFSVGVNSTKHSR